MAKNNWVRPWVDALPDDYIRADYRHHDKYASLGLAALERCPISFLLHSERDRDEVANKFSLAKYVDIWVPLDKVSEEIDRILGK